MSQYIGHYYFKTGPTFNFQAGFIELLYERFRIPVIVALGYLLLTIALQSWSLSERWDEPLTYNWPPFMALLYTLQRTGENIIIIVLSLIP